jgi:hypothetical protein
MLPKVNAAHVFTSGCGSIAGLTECHLVCWMFGTLIITSISHHESRGSHTESGGVGTSGDHWGPLGTMGDYGSAITRNPKTGAVITRNYTVITLHLKLHKRRVVYTGRQRHRTQSQQSALQSYVITAHRRHATVPPMCGAVLSSITPRPVTLHLESRASLCQALGTGTTSAPLRGRLHARRIYALAVG